MYFLYSGGPFIYLQEEAYINNDSKTIVNNPLLEPEFNYYYNTVDNFRVLLFGLTPFEWIFFILSVTLPRNKAVSPLRTILQHRSVQIVLKVIEETSKETLKALFGFLLLSIISPVFLPIIFLFYVVSEIVRHVFHYRYGKKGVKAAGQDAMWGSTTDVCRPYISVGVIMRGHPNIDIIRSEFDNKILNLRDEAGELKYRKFQQVIRTELGYSIWKDVPTFNINNHIKLWTDPPSEDLKERETAGDLIEGYLDDHGSTPLPPDQPQWEILLLNAKSDSKGRYAIVMRLHHSIGDGVSLVRLITGALTEEPLVLPPVGITDTHPLLKCVVFFWALCLLPMELIKTLCDKDLNPIHGLPLSGKKIFTMSDSIKLEDLKTIKRAFGTTMNDVLMSCLSASLSRVFSRRWECCTPHVTVVMPFSYHDLTQDVRLVNSFLMGFLKLPTPSESESMTSDKRLLLIKSHCDKMKRDPGMMAMYCATRGLYALVPARVVDYLFSLTGPTMGASNVPGPKDEIHCWGDPVEDVGFYVPDRAPTGAGVGMLSYRGALRVGIMVDSALIGGKEEVKEIAAEFVKEVDNLLETINGEKKSICNENYN